LRTLLTLLLIIITLNSCKKNRPAPPPVKQNEFFQQSDLVNFQPYRLFTKAGEITNDSIVNSYVNQFRVHFYAPGNSMSDPDYQKFAVAAADSVLNVSKAPVIQAKRIITGTYDVFRSGGLVFLSDTSDIFFQLLTYKTFHTREQNGGFKYYDWESPLYVLKRRNDSLFFPMSKFILVSRGDFVTAFRSDHFNNVFKPQGTVMMGAKDTLLIQQFELTMTKTSE
jgi:hypothetical protein